MNNTITLKAIGEKDFLNNHFFIPYYQRGYRWTDKEVTDLLKDIYEFQSKRNKEEGEFYCLQPIVVINKNGIWEVDHIIPISNYNLNDLSQLRLCFHYTNCQPLLINDNVSKFNKVNQDNAFMLI